MTITTSCAVLPELVSGIGTGISGYYSYKAATRDPVEVTTISRDCLFYEWVPVSDEVWDTLPVKLKQSIGLNNKLAVQNCPNIEKP
ncbi:unnamed protein product [marine sediment metagenome]|uniref:Uncharacterized protein n=1 Tax=marine sediment metagenome TaxID=412755 RepID=X1RCA2_9ZZZZ